MTRWYRAYEGTVTDAKLAETALIANTSRSVVIATWHAILESCAITQGNGRFETTARRIAASLGEPVAIIEMVFVGLNEVKMIENNVVVAWSKRQFESDISTERSRKHRKASRNVNAALQQQHATPPETETETDSKTEIKKESSPKRVRTVYSDDFETKFWKPYPKTPIMSKKEAFREWKNLSVEQQTTACSAIAGFVTFLRANPTHSVVHACRFLSQGRGEGFQPEAPSEKVIADMAARGWQWTEGRWQKTEGVHEAA